LDYAANFGKDHFFHWQALFIFLSYLIYYVGIRGYRQFESEPLLASAGPGSIDGETDNTEGLMKDQTGFTPAELDKDKISDEQQAVLQQKYQYVAEQIIKAFSEEKIYLDAELNVQSLAKRLNLSPVVLSASIKHAFNKNFRNFVNEYRVEEVKKRLVNPAARQLSLLGIAYECGFNSEASFYRIFKSLTGISPKEYLARHLK